MKKRFYVVLISYILIFIGLIVFFIIGNPSQRRIIGAASGIWLIYSAIYLFGGLSKFLIALIYGGFTSLLLIFFPKYDLAFILIGTILFILNPLADLQNKIEKKLPHHQKSIFSKIRGSYEPFYEYRKEMKNYYHLPQMRKVYTKPRYFKLRQAIVVIMSAVAVFLVIRELNNLMNLLKNFNLHLFFASTYSVIVLIVLTVILYRKGFQSTLNILTVSIFPPIAYSLYVVVKPLYLGVILGSAVLLLGILVGIYEYIQYRRRVVYEYYHYYDNNKQAEVYANALFEPFVYNDSFYLVTQFKIRVSLSNFQKVFHEILVYSNFHRFFITAYTYDRNYVTLHADFHYKDRNRIDKFLIFLESLFEDSIEMEVIEDKEKQVYEKLFFHNDDYIVARTIYLADLLKHLEIKSEVIISMVAYFEDIENIRSLSRHYAVTRLPNLDLEDVLTVRIDVKVNNVDYIIDAKVREILLNLLIYKGQYVRVSVYY